MITLSSLLLFLFVFSFPPSFFSFPSSFSFPSTFYSFFLLVLVLVLFPSLLFLPLLEVQILDAGRRANNVKEK